MSTFWVIYGDVKVYTYKIMAEILDMADNSYLYYSWQTYVIELPIMHYPFIPVSRISDNLKFINHPWTLR